MSTPLSEQTSAEKLEILGRKHAVSHFEKGNFVDSPNEEVQKWLDRNLVISTQAEFDSLHDAYCKGFQSYHVEKWISELTPEQAADLRQQLTPSDSVTSPLPVSVAQEGASDGGNEPTDLFGWFRRIDAKITELASPASSVVPAPLVPEVVKETLEGLRELSSDAGDSRGRSGEYLSDSIQAIISKLNAALA